jgi:hypothetical protein
MAGPRVLAARLVPVQVRVAQRQAVQVAQQRSWSFQAHSKRAREMPVPARAEAVQALLPERLELALAELVVQGLPWFPARSKGAQLLAQRIRTARQRMPGLRQAEQV